MLDQTERVTKLGEAFGMSPRVARWLAAYDNRSAFAHVWAGIVGQNLLYYLGFVIGLTAYLNDESTATWVYP